MEKNAWCQNKFKYTCSDIMTPQVDGDIIRNTRWDSLTVLKGRLWVDRHSPGGVASLNERTEHSILSNTVSVDSNWFNLYIYFIQIYVSYFTVCVCNSLGHNYHPFHSSMHCHKIHFCLYGKDCIEFTIFLFGLWNISKTEQKAWNWGQRLTMACNGERRQRQILKHSRDRSVSVYACTALCKKVESYGN